MKKRHLRCRSVRAECQKSLPRMQLLQSFDGIQLTFFLYFTLDQTLILGFDGKSNNVQIMQALFPDFPGMHSLDKPDN